MFSRVLLFLLAFQSGNPGLTGTVTTADGHPVAGAAVLTQEFNQGGGYGNVEVKTGEDGRFSTITGGKVLYVRKPGFVPLSRKLQPGETDLRIIVEPVSEERTMRIPGCMERYRLSGETLSNRKLWPKGMRFLGLWHVYPVPKSLHIKSRTDTDYGIHLISYPKNKKVRMGIHWGLMWGGHYPYLELYKNAATFTERALNTGENTEEIRGTLSNGNKFRWVGGRTSDAFYDDAPPEAAAFFDKIIDQGCFVN